jgi:hypothetical protein
MASIQGVYVALFGRPADPNGLAYFNTATNSGADLTAIGDLAATQEYKDRFKDQSNTQIITAIYQSLFGRDPEAAGLNFFVDALNKGTLNINNIAIAILDGATGADKTIVDTKVAAADAFTAALDTATEIGAYTGNGAAAKGIEFLKGITTTAPTAAEVETAVAGVVSADAAGNTISVAAGTDLNVVVGTSTTTNTTDKNDTINATGTATAAANGDDDAWNFAAGKDKLDGGLGTDTFNVGLDGAATVQADALKSVEIINIKSADNAAALNVGNAKELTQVWNDASTKNLAVSDIAASTTVGLKGAIGANTTTFALKDTAGSTTVDLALNGATTTGAVTIAGVETVNVANSGTSSVSALTLGAGEVINVTGSGSLTLGSPSTTVTKVDASAFTGNLTIDTQVQTSLTSLKGGSGNDTLTVESDSANVVVEAGAGNDTLNVAASATTDFTVSLTGGAGSDIFVLGSDAVFDNIDITDNAELLKSLVTITDFDKAADAIKINTATATWDKLLPAEAADVGDEATLLAAVTKAAGYTATGEATAFIYGSDAYIYSDSNNDGALNAGDGIVKVTGVSDIADLTATNFQVI